jgi:cold shock CspA family protein
MKTQAELDFQGMEPNEAVRQEIARQIDQLEQRFGGIIACRVAVRGPGQHHRTGGLYQINVHLTLPDGKDVTVDHVPQDDERFADIHFAVNDTFKRARRQLQGQAQKLRRRVKHHEPPPAGHVARLDDSGEFGFIQTTDGREIYFHRNSVLNNGFNQLEVGARVLFAEEVGEKGPQASTVKPLGKYGLRT